MVFVDKGVGRPAPNVGSKTASSEISRATESALDRIIRARTVESKRKASRAASRVVVPLTSRMVSRAVWLSGSVNRLLAAVLLENAFLRLLTIQSGVWKGPRRAVSSLAIGGYSDQASARSLVPIRGGSVRESRYWHGCEPPDRRTR